MFQNSLKKIVILNTRLLLLILHQYCQVPTTYYSKNYLTLGTTLQRKKYTFIWSNYLHHPE